MVKKLALSLGVLIVLVAFSTQAFAVEKRLTVRVTVDEWSMKLDKTGFPYGEPVRFIITNNGKIAHSFRVEGQGLEATTLAIRPGRMGTLDVILPVKGMYRLYCPIAGHREAGMVGEFETVTE